MCEFLIKSTEFTEEKQVTQSHEKMYNRPPNLPPENQHPLLILIRPSPLFIHLG